MSVPNRNEYIEHDGSTALPLFPLFLYPAPSITGVSSPLPHGVGTTGRRQSRSIMPGLGTPIGSTSTVVGPPSPLPPGVGFAGRRQSSSSGNCHQRILCPVLGCLEASISSNRFFGDFASIKNHLNDHCTGHLSRAVLVEFISYYSYSQCSICDKILHTKFHGSCPKCRPSARTRDMMDTMRTHVNTPNNIPTVNPQSAPIQEQRACPHCLKSISSLFQPSRTFPWD